MMGPGPTGTALISPIGLKCSQSLGTQSGFDALACNQSLETGVFCV